MARTYSSVRSMVAENNKTVDFACLRPIAGTRPRGHDPIHDLELEKTY